MQYSYLDLDTLTVIKPNCEKKDAKLWMKTLQENLKNWIHKVRFRNQWKERPEKGDIKTQWVELNGLKENLNVLQDWVSDNFPEKSAEKNFLNFFKDAIFGECFRNSHSKGKAWSLRRNLLFFLCSAIVPMVAAVALQFAAAGNATPLTPSGLILVGCIAFVWIFAFAYTKWYELYSCRETWGRYSVCYGRLQLALSRFVVSAQEKQDYQNLVYNTFEILQRNYDCFLQNLSNNSAAKGAVKGSQEKGAS